MNVLKIWFEPDNLLIFGKYFKTGYQFFALITGKKVSILVVPNKYMHNRFEKELKKCWVLDS